MNEYEYVHENERGEVENEAVRRVMEARSSICEDREEEKKKIEAKKERDRKKLEKKVNEMKKGQKSVKDMMNWLNSKKGSK